MLGPLRHFKLQFLSSEAEKKTRQCCGKTGISLMGSRCLHSTDTGSCLVGQGRERQCPQPCWPQRCCPSLHPHPSTHHLTLSFPHQHPQLCYQRFHPQKADSAFSLFPLESSQSTGELRQESPQNCRVGQTASPFLPELKHRKTMVYTL